MRQKPTRRPRPVRWALLVAISASLASPAPAQSAPPPETESEDETETGAESEAEAGTETEAEAETTAMGGLVGRPVPACPADCFVDESGIVRRATPTYRQLMRRPAPNYWLMAGLQAAALGAGTAWYWIDRDRQVGDWDFPSIKERFTFEAWRYDNNPFLINFFWHPLNGTGFHVFGRANDLSLLESVGYGFLTSMVWEIGLEFREKVSINDVIVTTGVGVATGEFAHWLGRYLNSAGRNLSSAHAALRYTLGFPRAIHSRVETSREPLATSETDNLGLAADIWHRFYIGSAYTFSSVSSDLLTDEPGLHLGGVEAAGELVAIPGYRRPGRFDRWFFDGNVSSLRVALGLGADSKTLDVDSFALPLGYISQDIASDRSSGHSLLVGPAIAYRLHSQDLGSWRDRVGTFALPGLGVDATWFFDGWELRLRGRANAEFVGVQSLPYPLWRDLNPDAGEKTILRKQSYYYGWGGALSLDLQFRSDWLEVRSYLLAARYDSDEGLDRSQEDIRADIDADDALEHLGVLVRLPIGPKWRIGTGFDVKYRSADLDGIDVEATVVRFDLSLGVEF